MKDIKIIEFKAYCGDHEPVRAILEQENARYVGLDHQIDTYFNVPAGRLKMREGTIERKLIYYQRPNQAGPKQSDVQLYPVDEQQSPVLKQLLTQALGIKVVVDKRRHIYFIDNVKIHLDEVAGLGMFVEVEAIDSEGNMAVEILSQQCNRLLNQFGVKEADLVAHSYSDMLLTES